jgi:hypothetical protein
LRADCCAPRLLLGRLRGRRLLGRKLKYRQAGRSDPIRPGLPQTDHRSGWLERTVRLRQLVAAVRTNEAVLMPFG